MPTTLLLSLHCKRTEEIDLKHPLRLYIATTYGARAAEDVSDDLSMLQTLRDDICNLSGSLQGLRQTLGKYYRMLDLISSRFPIGRGPDDITIPFSWADAFKPSKKRELSSLDFEKAAVLFNLGAVTSQMALGCDRSTDAGLRESARLFQEAAGCFEGLREGLCLRLERPPPVDLSLEASDLLVNLMLAQAQECVFEKAAADRKTAALLARLAKQVSVYYDACAKLLASPPLASHFDKTWAAHVRVKSALFWVEAMTQSSAGLASSDPLSGVAREISRLRLARDRLADAKKEARGASKELQDDVAAKTAAVAARLFKAEQENNTIYLQRVPGEADLPPIVPAALVKPLPVAELDPVDAEVRSVFSAVVPEATTRALSRYTDALDERVRGATDALAAASDAARLRLREWELPEALQALEPGAAATLPDAVRVALEDIERAGGASHLREVAQQLRDLRRVAVEELSAAERDLQAEEADDARLRGHFGPRWTRTPSAQLTRAMRERAGGYRSNLAVAGESDARLERRLDGEADAFEALSVEAAAAEMPGLRAPMLSIDDMEPATTLSTLRNALEELNTLSGQRASIEEALKERKQRDNILPKLLASKDTDVLFKAELGKYDDLLAEAETNVRRQDELLSVVQLAQAKFKDDYGYEDWRRACTTAGSSVREQCRRYKELQDNLAEGLRFYMSLQEAIAQLKQQVGDYVFTRKLQRDELVESLQQNPAAHQLAQGMAGMRLGGAPGSQAQDFAQPRQAPANAPGPYPAGPYHQQYPQYQAGGGPPVYPGGTAPQPPVQGWAPAPLPGRGQPALAPADGQHPSYHQAAYGYAPPTTQQP